MNGRSFNTTSSRSRTSPEVVRTVRRALPLALVAAILGAIVAAGLGAALVAVNPVKYTAAAEFNVIGRSPEITPLSRSKGLTAEQVARGLKESRADEFAASAAPPDEYTAKWVPGPGFGEISYQVTSEDPEIATAAAQAVFDNAGFLGFRLAESGREPSALDLIEVRKATPTRQSAAKTVAAAAVLGGFSGLALVLLFAVPLRRPQPA